MKKEMNIEERIAETYLLQLGLGIPRFECTDPPDFSLGNIGIEVRRFNQNYFSPEGTRGLEEVEIPVSKVIREVVESFDKQYDGTTFWVTASFLRPYSMSSKLLKKEIKLGLENFLKAGGNSSYYKMRLNESIWLNFYLGTSTQGRTFRFLSTNDLDGGGSLKDILENLDHCIQEKSEKIEGNRSRYAEWWLVLIQFMGIPPLSAFSELESQVLSSPPISKGSFDKVILVDPNTLKEIIRME